MLLLAYNPTTSLSHPSSSSFRPNHRLAVTATATTRRLPCPSRSTTMYELLSVSETAATKEIKAAYKKQAKLWHPDVCPSDNKGFFAQQFMRAREAYEVLCDPVLREDYDLALWAGITPSSWATTLDGAGERARGCGDWESQLDGLQQRKATRDAATRDTWGSRMRSANQSGLYDL